MTNYISNVGKAKVKALIFGAMLGPTLGLAAPTNLCYVNEAAGGAKDGTSWLDAYSNPQDALANPLCTEIWVAQGVYKPTSGTDQTISFVISPGVAMYGGFAGGESNLETRDPTRYRTILSGDLQDDDANAATTHVDATSADIRGSNSFHVVELNGDSSAKIGLSTVLNGFTITGGNAVNGAFDGGGGLRCYGAGEGNSCSPTLGLDIFSGNNASGYGGGMYDDALDGGAASPALLDVVFTGNNATDGGGMYVISSTAKSDTPGISTPNLFNVTFDHNSATSAGGAMFNQAQEDGTLSPKLENVTFNANQVIGGAGMGGAVFNTSNSGEVSPQFMNVTFFANVAGFGGAIYSEGVAGSGGNTSTKLTNVTFESNSSESGGAIYNLGEISASVNAELHNVILWADAASVDSGTSEIFNHSASVSIFYSVVANGCPADAAFTCLTIYTGDPKLGPLANNGGFTQTLVPATGSSAIDVADDSVCPPGDQRGASRPQGPHCDIGAVEVVANPPPMAQRASVITPINVPIQITLIGTDANPGGPFSYSPTKPKHGAVAISGNIATYTPDTDFTGADSFDYTVTDTNGISAPATVSITVTSGPPVAKSFAIEIPHNTSASMTVSATDPNVGTFTFTFAFVSPTTHGTVSLSGDTALYTPTHNYTGPDEFTYTATDLNGTSLPATVTIQVDPAPPVADDKFVTTPYNTSKQIMLSGSDNDNLGGPFALTFSLASSPAHGTLSAIGGSIVTYTPNHNYSGPDSFTYDTTDENGESKPALVQITVLPPGAAPPPSNTTAIPTLSTWGLLALAGLIGLTTIGRRRKV